MGFEDRLEDIRVKYEALCQKLLEPEKLGSELTRIAKEHANLEPIANKIDEYFRTRDNLAGARELLEDRTLDADFRKVVEEEIAGDSKILPTIRRELEVFLLPRDEADEKSAILEIRAGTGGDEAALFGADLREMYQRYAERKGWKFEVLNISENDLGGVREAVILIKGKNVFRQLKFESGVHRVQRVPETESKGRVHTSAATVAVLPEVEDVDIKINEKDLEITVCRAGGPGGQCVNTTDSAVRIVHLPTGITVRQQDEKSQHQNKEKAMKILRAKLYDRERTKRDRERALERKGQVGSGDRSEKIRTYNYPQNRVTDHRINMTLHRIDQITSEGDLDEIVEALIADDEAKKIGAQDY
ncbi:MAG: peptide chain release factor 1 [Rickettsiales bacterium]|jgi:peptide chain release factor 1|nr:peptide chain release factor 1 [Rickettsiales bacterium]